MEDKLWELFCETGDIRLYLMYRGETVSELLIEAETETESEAES